MVTRNLSLACVMAALTLAPVARAEEEAPRKVVLVDRVIAKWRTTGEGQTAHAIFARELAFEARLEAMALDDAPDAPLTDRHLRAALARHVTESLLEGLPLEPVATPADIAERAEKARRALEVRVGGADRLEAARKLERIGPDELDAMMRRTARASLYLDRMIAPLVEPSDLELRELHASGKSPYSDQRFADVVDKLRRWVVAQRVSAALDDFWQRSRSRIVIQWIKPDRTR